MKFRLTIQQQNILLQARSVSDGTFSYRVGSTDGAIIKAIFARYILWLSPYLATGKTFETELDAWTMFVNSMADIASIPKYAELQDAAFVLCKANKEGARFLTRNGSWAPITEAWSSSEPTAFGLYKAHGKLLRVAMAKDRFGFCTPRAAKPTALSASCE